jgi:O-antigen/teichoic acid export membrane protein
MQPADRVPAACIVAASLLLQGYRTSEGVFRVFDRFDLMGLIQVGCAAVQLTIAAALFWIEAPFAAYAGLVAAAIALPSAVQLAAALSLLRKRGLRPRFGGIVSRDGDRREFVAYCWTTSVTSTCDTIRQNGDSPLVGLLISVEAAGIYNVAKQLAGIIRKGASIYASVLFPELASMAARQDMAGARRIMGKAVAASLAVIVFVVIASGAFGGLALEILFGPTFGPGHLALVILCGAAGLQMLGATYSLYVQSFIGPVALFRSYLVATAAFLALTWPALALIGLPGAALGQVVFSLALALACWIQLRGQGLFGENRP